MYTFYKIYKKCLNINKQKLFDKYSINFLTYILVLNITKCFIILNLSTNSFLKSYQFLEKNTNIRYKILKNKEKYEQINKNNIF